MVVRLGRLDDLAAFTPIVMLISFSVSDVCTSVTRELHVVGWCGRWIRLSIDPENEFRMTVL